MAVVVVPRLASVISHRAPTSRSRLRGSSQDDQQLQSHIGASLSRRFTFRSGCQKRLRDGL
jgi:hypothetical protein